MLLIILFGSFSVPRRYRIIRVAYSAAYIHEAAAAGVIKRASTAGMIREAGARGNEPADNNVFLQAAQVVLQATNRRFGEDAGGLLE